jgi:hypothetical protein
MARIVLAGYMFRYPLGGMLSNTLQYLFGLVKLGHDVYFVEQSEYETACYDPGQNRMANDCRYGIEHVSALLSRFGLTDRWCFRDFDGNYFGLSKKQVEELFETADLFIDYGAHGSWNEAAHETPLTVLIDGEPGTTQMKMCLKTEQGQALPDYDFYYTVGQNVGEENCTVPEAGKTWRKIFHPVDTEQFSHVQENPRGAYSTVMNWKSRENLEFRGTVYGHKDVEFDKFLVLPNKAPVPFEIAVAGTNIPESELVKNHWNIRNAHQITLTYDSFIDFIAESRGEFSVCKNTFVATNSGWFSDRSAAYLACGKPVVVQDTGFGAPLPVGQGLFAVRTVDEAVEAIAEIESDYTHHSKCARAIACDCLDSQKVIRKFIRELGI